MEMEISREVVVNWTQKVRIRALRKDDLPALEWEGTYIHFRRLYRMAYWRSLKGNAQLWLADFDHQKVVGQVFVLLNSEADRKIADGRKRAFIHSFRVRPEFRNAGIGAQLMAHAESELVARKFCSVSLNVAQDNPGALRFYEQAGYKKVVKEAGQWSYVDHLGRDQEVNEPSWRMRKLI